MGSVASHAVACVETLALRVARTLLSARTLVATSERVAEQMSRNVETVAPDATLHSAALRMWERDVGSLIVTNGVGARRVLGVITDRDICMAAQLRGLRLSEMRVREAMASPAVLCRETDALSVAHSRMREHQVRRLPVVDKSGQLSGVITLADLSRDAVSAPNSAMSEARAAEVAASLAAICAGRQ